MEKMTLTVTGMMCGHCEKAAQNALLALDGVASAVARHEANTVEIEFDPQLVGREQFAAAIEGAGYTVA